MIRESELRTTNRVTKVEVDQEDAGIYKHFDSRSSTTFYYKCLEPRVKELSDEKILYIYAMETRTTQSMLMMDKYRRRYKIAKMKELAEFTIVGHSLRT